MTEREREPYREPETRLRSMEELEQGEMLVDGSFGGTENVSDVSRETKGTGRKIGAVLVGLLALILLALPIAWALGTLAAVGAPLGPPVSALTWVYASLLVVLGIGAAFYAYTLLQEGIR